MTTNVSALNKLKQEFNENKNSHVFLVETNTWQKALLDIKDVIKNILGNNEQINIQIDDGSYLELITVTPDGKDIKKEQIMNLQMRIKTKPLLSKFIFYIITPAELINEIAANKLLKTIEEPNSNVIGFLITTNADLLLPTIKSRCEKLVLMYDDDKDKEDISEDVHNVAKKLIKCIELNDHITFYKIKMNDKTLKENYKTVENLLKDYYNMACNLVSLSSLDTSIIEFIKEKNDLNKLIKKTKYLNELLNRLIKNMNGDLLLEKIFLEFRGL